MPTVEQFSKRRETFLRQEFPKQYREMQKDGSLAEHLEQVGQEAEEMWSDLRAQMTNNPDMPQEMGARFQAFEAIPIKLWEIVNEALILRPPGR